MDLVHSDKFLVLREPQRLLQGLKNWARPHPGSLVAGLDEAQTGCCGVFEFGRALQVLVRWPEHAVLETLPQKTFLPDSIAEIFYQRVKGFAGLTRRRGALLVIVDQAKRGEGSSPAGGERCPEEVNAQSRGVAARWKGSSWRWWGEEEGEHFG